MRQIHAGHFIFGLLVAVVARASVFREGGTVGAYLCFAVFAICVLGLMVLAARRLIVERSFLSRLKWALLVLALAAGVYDGAVTSGPTDSIGATILIFSLAALFVILAVEWVRRDKRVVDPAR